jgi:hypothetical protein
MDIAQVKNLFTFRMSGDVFATVKAEVMHLSDVYESLTDFTADDLKAAYKANAEDADFIKSVAESIAVARAKGILVSEETAARLLLKLTFIQQASIIVAKLRKLADKLEAANTIALAEAYTLSTVVHDAIGNAAKQSIEGAATLHTEIAEQKTRAIRKAETRKKNEAAKRKMGKAA